MARSTETKPVEAVELGSLIIPERLETWVWVLGYTAMLSSLSILKDGLFLSTGFDLGLYRQAMWLIWHVGPGAVSTFTNYPVLAHSGAFVLVLLAPLYHWAGPGFLLALQSFCLGLGYWFIRKIGADLGMSRGGAHRLGLVYLLFPTVLGANLFDFHPECLAVVVVFAVIRWGIQNRPLWAWAGALAGFLVTDTVGLVWLGLGVGLLVSGRSRRAGLGLIGLALAGTWLDIGLVIPALSGGGIPQWAADFGPFGASPAAGLAYLGHHPDVLLKWVHQTRAWEYLALLAAPLAWWPLRARAIPWWWLAGLPVLAMELWSSSPASTSPFDPSSLILVPVLFLGAARAASAASPRATFQRFWWPLPLAVLLVFAYVQNKTVLHRMPSNSSALLAAVDSVPAQVPVATQNSLAPHLAQRRSIWLFDNWAGRRIPAGTYLVVDTQSAAPLPPSAQQLLANPHVVQKISAKGGVEVLKTTTAWVAPTSPEGGKTP